MIGRFRRRLADIRRHSAGRPRSIWGRLIDRSAWITAILAVFAMLASENVVTRDVALHSQRAILYGPRDGSRPLVASFLQDDGLSRGSDVLWGELTLQRTERRQGWPVVSRIDSGRLLVDLNDYMLEGSAITELGPSSPVRAAIDRVVARGGYEVDPSIAEAWRSPFGASRTFERYWIGSLLGAGVWWVLLFVASVVFIRLFQLLFTIARNKRWGRAYSRVAVGRCAKCNYDLTGLEFSERCPECGALTGVWDE